MSAPVLSLSSLISSKLVAIDLDMRSSRSGLPARAHGFGAVGHNVLGEELAKYLRCNRCRRREVGCLWLQQNFILCLIC